MAGATSHTAAISGGPLNGARATYEVHGPNSASSKASLTGSYRQTSGTRSRMPLSNVTPNRKGIAEHTRPDDLTHQGDTSRTGREPDRQPQPQQQQQQQQQQQPQPQPQPLDLHSRNNSYSIAVRSPLIDNDIPENMWRPEEDDPEGWIHRDKLAKIESEELQAAGIGLATRRQYGKSGRRGSSRDRKADDVLMEQREEQKPGLAESPLTEEEAERKNWDLRTPDEIAAEPGFVPSPLGSPASSMVKKTSGSRIPVLAASPHPIPPERLERETPLPRKRTMSNSMSPDEGIWVDKKHSRKNSATSQTLLDAADAAAAAAAADDPSPGPADGSDGLNINKSGSPRKQRTGTLGIGSTSSGSPRARRVTPTAAAAAAASRKNLPGQKNEPGRNVSGSAAPSAAAGSSQQQRSQTTKSQDPERPRTAVNRPEGDPPWLATMYKPDPRLPPDQQIIPTHARMQQVAQWEADGAVPKTYDRNFQPLAVHDADVLARPMPTTQPNPPGNSSEQSAAAATSNNNNNNNSNPTSPQVPPKATWPLRPTATKTANDSSSRPGTGASSIGAYSTMPKVTNVPGRHHQPSNLKSPRPSGPLKLQEPAPGVGGAEKARDDDDGTVKKGCACCAVM